MNESAAADRQKKLSNEMHRRSEKVFKEQPSIFEGLLIQKSNNKTISLLIEIKKAKVQNFWEKLGKMYKTDVSQSMAPLENESNNFFGNNEKTQLLRETFFTGEHVTKFNFDNTFVDSINEEVKHLSVHSGEHTHLCNDPVRWQ